MHQWFGGTMWVRLRIASTHPALTEPDGVINLHHSGMK